jgi:hypothetical protein
MLIDWLSGDLHHWAIFCCTVATLGLIGAFWVALAAAGGKGIFAFLNGSRAPTVIVVNGGTYVPPPVKRHWGFVRIWLLCAAIFSGGPMLTLLIMGVNAAAWYVLDWIGAHWVLFLILGLLALIVGAVAMLIRRDAHTISQERTQLAALPAHVPAPAVAAEPLVGWSLDPNAPQWSDR